MHKPYKKPKLEVYLNPEKNGIKHVKVKSLGSKASFQKLKTLKTESDQGEENTIDLMKRHYHNVNNNVHVSVSPSSFLRRLEEAKNNMVCPEESPFDPAQNQFTFLESLNKRAEHNKNIKNLKGLGSGATPGGLSVQRGAGVYLYAEQSSNRKSRNYRNRGTKTGLERQR